MKKCEKKYIKERMLVLFLCVILSSCSKWDEFKSYIQDGQITYVGKLDSVRIQSGDGRIKVKAFLKPDPKLNEVRVFWNNRMDSAVFILDTITKKRGVFEQVIPMPEGIVSLTLITYDQLGNKSIPVSSVGRAYGERYKNGLNNRLVGSAILESGKATIEWLEMDQSAGPFATEIKYLSANGKEKTERIPLEAKKSVLSDIAITAKALSYRTLFLPQSTSIDTFATDYVQLGLARDITEEVLKNTKAPFAVDSRDGRWAIPAYWVVNEAAKNYRNNLGVYFGGLDYNSGSVLAMEAGWSSDNMKTIDNGKIYQTVNLPAGDYTLEMDIPGCSSGGDFYTVAAKGISIPDTKNIATSLGYAKTNTVGTSKVSFTIDTQTQLSIGFVGNLQNKGSGDGTFWRITGVRLKQTVKIK